MLHGVLSFSVPPPSPHSDCVNISAGNMAFRHAMKHQRQCGSLENHVCANICIPPILTQTSHTMQAVKRWAVLCLTIYNLNFKKEIGIIYLCFFLWKGETPAKGPLPGPRIPTPTPRLDPKEVAEKLSNLTQLEDLPGGLIRWWEKSRGLQPKTVLLYRHPVSQFLSVMKILDPSRAPSLKSVWNLELCQLFFQIMSELVCESTLVNYHNALISVRLYLKRNNICPANFSNLLEEFRDMQAAANKRKRSYVRRRKELVQSDSTLVYLFYHRIYHNKRKFRRFYAIYDRIKLAIREGSPVQKVNRKELFFCNALLISLLTADNFHRTGNICQIECEAARVETKRARKVLQKKFPGMKLVSEDERILDRRFVEPAVISVDRGTKQAATVKFVILNPRDIDAISAYIKMREFFPQSPKTSKLLVNSRGKSVSSNITHYLRRMGDSVKINGLNCITLRALMETENVLDVSNIPGSSEVSNHLGHSPQVRSQYYVLPDKRHHVQAAERLRYKFEEIGEDRNHPVSYFCLPLTQINERFFKCDAIHFSCNSCLHWLCRPPPWPRRNAQTAQDKTFQRWKFRPTKFGATNVFMLCKIPS